MDKNYNRSIDGLAPSGSRNMVGRRPVVLRTPNPTARRVGELPSASMRRRPMSRPEARPVRRVVRKAIPKEVQEESDFGLTKNAIAKERMRLNATEDFLKPVSSLDFDLSSDDLKKDPNKKRSGKKHRRKLALKIMGGIFGVLLLAGIGVFIWGNGLISRITGGESGLFDIFNSAVELRMDKNGRTNILAFGTSGYEMAGSGHDGAQLTDSIMIISLDQKTKDVAMISFPRDLYVGNTCTSTGKINEVYWCANQNDNNEQGGAEALKTVLEGMLGIEIQYRAHVDWGALVQIVDGIGGITVTLDNDVNDYNYTKIVIPANTPTVLNGEQALGLARARHGTVGGDFSRGENQQKILAGIQDKITKDGIGLTQVINLVNAAGDNIRMNFSIDELKTLFSLSGEMSLNNMRQIPLVSYDGSESYMTTAEINSISYVIPVEGVGKYDALQNYVSKMLSSDPAKREDAKIAVLNGSGTAGAAATERDRIEATGYEVAMIGDVPGDDYYPEMYYVYAVNDNCPGTKAALASRYRLPVKDASEIPAGINTAGLDFIIIVGGNYIINE